MPRSRERTAAERCLTLPDSARHRPKAAVPEGGTVVGYTGLAWLTALHATLEAKRVSTGWRVATLASAASRKLESRYDFQPVTCSNRSTARCGSRTF